MSDVVAGALERTIAERNARIRITREIRPPDEPRRLPRRRRTGGLLSPAVQRAALVVANRWQHFVARLGTTNGVGVVDLERWRGMVDLGAYAMLVEEGRMWSGIPGTPRDETVYIADPFRGLEPLWMLDLLRGATPATESGGRLEVTVDAIAAADAAPYDLMLPRARTVEDLRHFPMTVRLDPEGRLAEVACESEGTLTLTFESFGTEDDADWTRLPRLHPES